MPPYLFIGFGAMGGISCSVKGCSSKNLSGKQRKKTSIFQLPNPGKRIRAKWLEKLGLTEEKLRCHPPIKICQKHFEPNCYRKSNEEGKIRRATLLANAVPTLDIQEIQIQGVQVPKEDPKGSLALDQYDYIYNFEHFKGNFKYKLDLMNHWRYDISDDEIFFYTVFETVTYFRIEKFIKITKTMEVFITYQDKIIDVNTENQEFLNKGKIGLWSNMQKFLTFYTN